MVFGVKTLVKFCSNHTSPYKTLRSTIWVIHGSCHSLTQIPNSEVDDLKGFNHLLREPKNWQLRSPNRKTWTKKPTNLLLHFKHEIQVIHEGLVPNPPWNCEFIPENGCFKNTILSFSNGLFSGVNLLVVSGRVSIFSKATKKSSTKSTFPSKSPHPLLLPPWRIHEIQQVSQGIGKFRWCHDRNNPPQRDDGDGSRGWDKENLH